ncbi:MAG: hypothetical protein H8Z69_05400 [Nanohaloarchaea archaeon]|nr:hypothetical protein [Candidatus Nanohaloarchaea archaeon]
MLYTLDDADSLLKRYQNRNGEKELQVLPVRVEKSVVSNLEEVADRTPLVENRSSLVRAILKGFVEEADSK